MISRLEKERKEKKFLEKKKEKKPLGVGGCSFDINPGDYNQDIIDYLVW